MCVLRAQVLDEMIRAVDLNNDGIISIEEFTSTKLIGAQ